MTFPKFPKIPRFNREVVITEKIDGTNGLIYISDPYGGNTLLSNPPVVIESDGFQIAAGSHRRWIYPAMDNHGFAKWVFDNADELVKLGPGLHYGEWWGSGINRGYGFTRNEHFFSLFNVSRWNGETLGDIDVPNLTAVPILRNGSAAYLESMIEEELDHLRAHGSIAAPGFMRPEGIVIYHTAGNHLYKVTLEGDDLPKSLSQQRRLDAA